MLLMRTVTAYLLMIHWIFFNTIYQKKREKRTQVDPILTVRILSVSISPHHCSDFPGSRRSVGVATALAHARSAQTQAKSSAEHRESNRHRFVLSPSGSQTVADNINCFLGL